MAKPNPLNPLSRASSQTAKPLWWNRPLIGQKSLLQRVFEKFSNLRAPQKLEVSESTIFLHNREMTDAQVFAKTVEAIDNDKFGNPEFLLLVKLKFLLSKRLEGYGELWDSIQLLQIALAAKDSFLSLYQTELRYRSSKQQEFYAFVDELLNQNKNPVTFRQQTQAKLAELLPQIKTEEGKLALKSYQKQLETVAEQELGLRLLALFRAYQLTDYSILNKISEIINVLGKKALHDLKTVVTVIMVNYSIFEKLGPIIGISGNRSNPDTYARIVQYIALSYKHELSFSKFEELIKLMRRWYVSYLTILGIRQEHPPEEYKQPREFCQEIPGEKLYLKYNNWLTDQKTGYTYLDFEEAG